MPSKSNKTSQTSKEIIDISNLNITDKLGGAKKKEIKHDSETKSETEIEESDAEESDAESSEESNTDEQISSDDDRDIDEELEEAEIEEAEIEETEIEEAETEETDKETDVDEKTNIESDNESKEEENEENTKDKCYQKFSKKSIVDTEIDYDEYFIKDEEIIIIKSGRLTKPYLTKYEKVRILGDRSRQLAQGAKPMIKNTTGLSHKEVALLELKSKVIPLIIERPIPNVGVEKWKLSELEINF
jgi:DNA-directed RNA polymerase I, II, and III subunit RPABC2